MKYLFILGRNPELSSAELFSYFEKEQNKVIAHVKEKNAILFDLEEPIEGNMIEALGGTIAIGKVLAEGNWINLVKKLEAQEIYYGTSNKLNYCVWDFSKDDLKEKISDYLKKRFRQEKLKATEKNLNGFMELQEGGRVRIAKGKIDEEYFVFNDCFGKIIEKSDYRVIEERDMTKPERREALAISPRLAKIMIHLSQVKEGETLLDPFCGIGVILSEALYQGIKVVGVDIDENAINGAIKNLGWANFNKENYKLLVGDSTETKIGKINVLVSEPDLGAVLKKASNKKSAMKTIFEFENLISKVINNFKNEINGRVVFTAPLIKTSQNARVSCDITKIIEKTRLKLIKGPIQEYRKESIVGREIFVLCK